jgi:4'-phosphopantetheinyl transferase
MEAMELPSPGEVHVWTVDLDRPVGAAGGALSEDELLRAAKFKVDDGRRRFVGTRAALRTLLGRYLGKPPEALQFAAGAGGKPRLATPGSPLQFNVSHSGGVALIAVANGADVGVDVEEVAAREHRDGIARRVFTTAERDAIDDDESFYRHWVAKEAFVKATGKGVSSVRSFEVLLDAPGGARLTHVGGDPHEAARWTLAPLDAPPGYAAAAVSRGEAAFVQRRFE